MTDPEGRAPQVRLVAAAQASGPQLTLTNSSGQSVDILYVDQNQSYQLYQTLPAGQTLTVEGQVGLVLYFGVGGKSVIGTYTFQNLPQQQFAITPQMLSAAAGTQPATQQPAQAAGATASTNALPAPTSQAAVTPQLTLTNSSGQNVDVLYIDQNQSYQVYQSLPAGQAVTLAGQAGLVLYFGVGGKSIVGKYTILNQAQQQFAITPQMLAQSGAPNALQPVVQAPAATAAPALPAAQAQAPAATAAPALPAAQAAVAPQVTVTNNSGQTIGILELQGGNYHLDQRLPSGQSVTLPSSVGQVWYFGFNGKVVGNYKTLNEAQQQFAIGPRMVGKAGSTTTPVPTAQGNPGNPAGPAGVMLPAPASTPTPQLATPSTAPALPASNTTVSATPQVTITNSSGQSVDVLYADANGAYQLFQTLPVGGTVTLNSKVGLVWYFGTQGPDGKPAIIGNYPTQNQAQQQFAVTPQLLAQAGVQDAQAATASALPSLVPVRASMANAPWDAGSDQMVVMESSENGHVGFLSGDASGALTPAGIKDATAAADWYFEKVPGTTDQIFIRNGGNPDNFLSVPANAAAGTPVLFGQIDQGGSLGRWREVPDGLASGADLFYSVAQPNLVLAMVNGVTQLAADPTAKTLKPGLFWVPNPIPTQKAVIGALSGLVAELPHMQQVLDQMNADAAIAQQKQAAEAKKLQAIKDQQNAMAAREEANKKPLVMYSSPTLATVQLGVSVVNPAAGLTKEIAYSYPIDQSFSGQMQLGPFAATTDQRQQYAAATFLPTVYAYVKNGSVFLDVQTDQQVQITDGSGTTPATQGSYFLQNATLKLNSDIGSIVQFSPQTGNSQVLNGVSKDNTFSTNLSGNVSPNGPDAGGSVGISQTTGQSVNGTASDYEVASSRINGTNGGVSYSWSACGIVHGVPPKVGYGAATGQNSCTFGNPGDLFDADTSTLDVLSPDAFNTALSPSTETIFNLGRVEDLGVKFPEDVQMSAEIDLTVNAVSIYHTPVSTSKAIGQALLDGLEFKVLWDPKTRNWVGAGGDPNSMPENVGAQWQADGGHFLVQMRLNLSDLKN